MSTQGPNSVGTVTQTNLNMVDWSNINNIKASDNSYASAVVSAYNSTEYLWCTNFGFSIPAGVVINGIFVQIECKESTLDSLAQMIYPQLVYNGVVIGTALPGQYISSVTDYYMNFGGSTNVWGATLTSSILNDSTFGCIFSAEAGPVGATITVDHVRITIYYIVPTDKTVTETVSSVTETIAVATSTFDTFMANNNQAYILNRKTGYWTSQSNAPFTNALYRPSTQKILSVRRDLGQIVSFEGADFAGIDIGSVIQTGYMNLGEFDEIKAMDDKSSEANKRLRTFFADCKGEGDLTLTVYTENDSTGKTFTIDLGVTDNATLNAVRTALSRDIRGKYIAFKLTNSSGNDFFIGETRMKIMPKAIR